jgi:cell division protein FtsN
MSRRPQKQARRWPNRPLRRCHACWRGYVVQSGVVPDVRQAEAMQAKFAAEGIPVSIEVRLQLGPFRTRAEAEVGAPERSRDLGSTD